MIFSFVSVRCPLASWPCSELTRQALRRHGTARKLLQEIDGETIGVRVLVNRLKNLLSSTVIDAP